MPATPPAPSRAGPVGEGRHRGVIAANSFAGQAPRVHIVRIAGESAAQASNGPRGCTSSAPPGKRLPRHQTGSGGCRFSAWPVGGRQTSGRPAGAHLPPAPMHGLAGGVPRVHIVHVASGTGPWSAGGGSVAERDESAVPWLAQWGRVLDSTLRTGYMRGGNAPGRGVDNRCGNPGTSCGEPRGGVGTWSGWGEPVFSTGVIPRGGRWCR
jgi:hypothetical protein